MKQGSPRTLAGSPAPLARSAEDDADTELTRLIATFDQHGGVLGGDEVAELMRSSFDQPVSRLARWIVSREVVTIVHRTALYVPLFQFCQPRMELRPLCREAILELTGAMIDEDVARWFAAPNAWLEGVSPLQRLEHDSESVVAAARADRFVRCGW